MFKDMGVLTFALLAILACGSLAIDCSAKKDSGNGKDAVQKFYFNGKWGTCFGFKFTGKGGNENKFDSYSECMGKCAPLDGSPCTGPLPEKSPIEKPGGPPSFDCETATCPKGYTCRRGTMIHCCHEKQYDAVQAAFADKCPDGSKSNDIFGETCNDLVCKKDQKCVKINEHFAKCCGGK